MSNGPGEVWGWAFPVARALRRLFRATVRLALPPCQYATGTEADLARRSGLFAEVIEPRVCVRLSLGLGERPADCVVHLGGDLWYAVRLGRRAGCPVLAYVERPLIAPRHRAFAWIGTNTAALARRLVALGVPEEKVETVGELRADAVLFALGSFLPSSWTDRERLLLLLPGSRASLVRDLVPLMVRIGEHVRRAHPDVEVALVASPFLPVGLVEEVKRESRVRVVFDDAERVEAYRRAVLALTVPGTSTLELAFLHTPMVVWLPLYDPARLPVEGIVEWVGRVPVVGRAAKAAVVRRYFRTPRPVSLPNRLAAEPVVEEVVGDAPVEAVAQRLIALLQAPEQLAAMHERLRLRFPCVPGAAERIARRIAEVAA